MTKKTKIYKKMKI